MQTRITSRDVPCPTCAAAPGQPCRGSAYAGRAHRPVDAHIARRSAARQAREDTDHA